MPRRLSLEERLLCRIARVPRAGDGADPVELRDPRVDWERVWNLALRHEVQPLAWAWLRSRPERRSAVAAPIAQRAERTYFATALRNAGRAAVLGEILDALGAAGIAVIPVKGVALAELVYGADAPRTFDDLDVLVRRHQLADARHHLHDLGWRPRAVPKFEEVDHRFHDLQLFRSVAGEEVCLELHWDLWSPLRFDSIVDELWERSEHTVLGGRSVRSLSTEDTLLHLAIHRTSAALRLRHVCDVAEIVKVHDDVLDWEGLAERADRVGAGVALHVVLDLAARLLDAPVPGAILGRLRPGPVRRRVLDRTCGVSALFRPVGWDDHGQQPHLAYRILEQDRLMRVLSSLVFGAVRKVRKAAYHRRAGAAG